MPRFPPVAVALAVGLVSARLAVAQEAARAGRAIEEIIVTAQKSEQKLQDVPISISVMDATFLSEQAVTDFKDLSDLAANFKINNEGGTIPPPDIRIRGFGTNDANRAFEQSVGLSIDGDTFGQQEYFQSALFDLERIEVLKGPQGTLFGKNTTAGLLNVVLAEPTDDFGGRIDLQYGELDRRRLEAAIGGPLFPGILNFRVAGLLDERDGLVENTTARIAPEAYDRLGGREREALRVKLELPEVLGTSVRFTAEETHFDVTGTGFETYDANEAVQAFQRKYDPDADTIAGNYVASFDFPSGSDRTVRRLAANANRAFGGWSVDAVLGRAWLDSQDFVDVDLGPTPMGFGEANDGGNQTTAELRGSSPRLEGLLGLGRIAGFDLGQSEVIVGGFFQRKRVMTNTELALNVVILGEGEAAAEGVPPNPSGADANRNLPTNSTTSDFSQRTLSYAGFAHARWYPIERLTLEYGMRLTHETKDARVQRYYDSAASEAVFNALGLETFDLRGLHRSELGFTPKVALIYDVTDDVNVFGTWTIGFKSGGFNENATSTTEEFLVYDRETMRSWELGSKTTLLDGAASLNVQLFWMQATNLQLFTIVPGTGINAIGGPTNAGEARSRGVEADATWLPTDWATLRGSLGFDDTVFLDYPFGTCENGVEDPDGDGDARCDLTGQPLPFTPKWDVSVTAGVRYPLPAAIGTAELPLWDGVAFVGSLTTLYEDVHFANRTDDPRSREPSSFTFDLQLGLASEERGWSLMVTCQNLLDERTRLLRRTPINAGSFRELNTPPRLWFGTLHWDF